MKIEIKKLTELKPAPYNPRQSNAEQEKQLKSSLEKFGVVEPIIFNKQTGYIVGGHFRIRELKKLGYKEIECVIVDLNEADEKELNIRLNANTGSWDWDELANNWDSELLSDWGLEIPGFEPTILEAEEDDFNAPEGGIETDIVLGDLFEIGEHRLLCGDSTDSDAVARLMNGEKADITFTSPPYNAGDNSLGGNKNKVDNKYETYDDKKDQSDWKQFVSDVLKNCLINSENVFYNIQQLAGNKIGFIELLYEYRNQFVDEIFWIKGHGQPAAAKNVLNSRVEHILIYRNEDKPKRTITTGDFHGTLSNYYEGNGNSKNEFSKIHAATFPIHLPEYVITNYSQKSVLDVFLGTGTTMVASHQLKRKCYGMELDPKYCQVIIDRMKKLDPTIKIKRNGIELK